MLRKLQVNVTITILTIFFLMATTSALIKNPSVPNMDQPKVQPSSIIINISGESVNRSDFWGNYFFGDYDLDFLFGNAFTSCTDSDACGYLYPGEVCNEGSKCGFFSSCSQITDEEGGCLGGYAKYQFGSNNFNGTGNGTFGNLYPQTTLIYDIGSGANRWRWLYVQNISAENINSYTGYFSDNLTVMDGICNATNCYTIADFLLDTTGGSSSGPWTNNSIITFIAPQYPQNIDIKTGNFKTEGIVTAGQFVGYGSTVTLYSYGQSGFFDLSFFNSSVYITEPSVGLSVGSLTDPEEGSIRVLNNGTFGDTVTASNLFAFLNWSYLLNVPSFLLTELDPTTWTNSFNSTGDSRWLDGNLSFNQSLTDSLYYLKTNPNNYVNVTSISNATIARAGNYNCTGSNVLQNITSNSSGIFGQCVAVSSGGGDFVTRPVGNITNLTITDKLLVNTTRILGTCSNPTGSISLTQHDDPSAVYDSSANHAYRVYSVCDINGYDVFSIGYVTNNINAVYDMDPYYITVDLSSVSHSGYTYKIFKSYNGGDYDSSTEQTGSFDDIEPNYDPFINCVGASCDLTPTNITYSTTTHQINAKVNYDDTQTIDTTGKSWLSLKNYGVKLIEFVPRWNRVTNGWETLLKLSGTQALLISNDDGLIRFAPGTTSKIESEGANLGFSKLNGLKGTTVDFNYTQAVFWDRLQVKQVSVSPPCETTAELGLLYQDGGKFGTCQDTGGAPYELLGGLISGDNRVLTLGGSGYLQVNNASGLGRIRVGDIIYSTPENEDYKALDNLVNPNLLVSADKSEIDFHKSFPEEIQTTIIESDENGKTTEITAISAGDWAMFNYKSIWELNEKVNQIKECAKKSADYKAYQICVGGI